MGQSTNGQICYGILLEEDTQLPWNDEIYDEGIEAWWRKLQGWNDEAESCWDAKGNDKPGTNSEAIANYFIRRKEFDAAHALPIELVNVCSGACPIYMVAIPHTVLTALRGTPLVFDPEALSRQTGHMNQVLTNFLGHHKIPFENEPAWYLSSYWG